MDQTEPLVIAITTVGNQRDAQRIAEKLIGQRLAACVQVDGPITSVYRWEDQLQKETEFRLTIKTSRCTLDKLKNELLKMHPYDEPEIICIHVDDAGDGYLAWVTQQTT